MILTLRFSRLAGFLLLLFTGYCPGFANPDPHWIPPEKDQLTIILDQIYNLEFNRAESGISEYRMKYPWRPEGFFAEGMVLWMQVLADLYNPALDSMFIAKMDDIIHAYNQVDENDSLYTVTKYYKSAAIGFKARLYINRSSWFKAAVTGIKAISGIMDALDGKYPNTDAKLGTGLYLYYADIVPDQYPFVLPLLLFYPSGNKKQGLADLKETSENGLFARTEAAYIYAQTLYIYEKQYYKAYRIMKKLNASYPANPVFLRWLAALSYSVADYQQASYCLDVYEKRVNRHIPFYKKHQLRFVHYRRGLIAERQRKWEEALEHYDKAMQPLPEKIEKEMERYRILSLLHKGRCLGYLKRYEEAAAIYQRVIEEPDVDSSRKKAEDALEKIQDKIRK